MFVDKEPLVQIFPAITKTRAPSPWQGQIYLLEFGLMLRNGGIIIDDKSQTTTSWLYLAQIRRCYPRVGLLDERYGTQIINVQLIWHRIVSSGAVISRFKHKTRERHWGGFGDHKCLSTDTVSD